MNLELHIPDFCLTMPLDKDARFARERNSLVKIARCRDLRLWVMSSSLLTLKTGDDTRSGVIDM